MATPKSRSLGEVDHLLDPDKLVRAQAGPRVRAAQDERVDGVDLAARDRAAVCRDTQHALSGVIAAAAAAAAAARASAT